MRSVVTLALVLQFAFGTTAIANDSNNNKIWLLRPIQSLLEKRLESAYSKAREQGWNFTGSASGDPIETLDRLKEKVFSENEFYLASERIAGSKSARFQVALVGANSRAIHVAFADPDQRASTDFSFDSSSLLSYRSVGKAIREQLHEYAESWVDHHLEAKAKGRVIFEEKTASRFLDSLLPKAYAGSEPVRLSRSTVLKVAIGLEIAAVIVVLIAALIILTGGFATGFLLIGAGLAITGWLVLFLPTASPLKRGA